MSEPLQLTKQQMRLLRNKICTSKDATPLAKQTVIWMLEQTQGMTKPVLLSIPGVKYKIGSQVAFGVHDMNSENGETFLHTFLKKLNTKFFFSSFGGTLVSASGKKRESSKAYIILISDRYDPTCQETILKYDPDAIEAIKI
jgi:hypothetical protein